MGFRNRQRLETRIRTSLSSSKISDSLDFASVLMALEDEFDIALQETDIEELNSINKLVAFVSAHSKQV